MIATEGGLLMKLFVIGATGRTGLEIVYQALARGHHVTAFVRSPESITLRNERLTVLKGMSRTKTNFLTRCKVTMRSFRH
jgi:putative NADH-flavin reductase